jgi:hypothetical protein
VGRALHVRRVVYRPGRRKARLLLPGLRPRLRLVHHHLGELRRAGDGAADRLEEGNAVAADGLVEEAVEHGGREI